MRILIVSTFFPPLNSIASLRPYSWAKHWAAEGHDVMVLTIEKTQDPSLDLPMQNTGFKVIEIKQPLLLSFIKNKLKGTASPSNAEQSGTPLSRCSKAFKTVKQQLLKSVHSIRQSTGIFSGCRMPDLSHLWVKPAINTLENHAPFDAVISTAGPYTVHLVAHSLKKKGRAKQWIADYRDTWSDNFLYPGLFPFNWWERRLEKKLLTSADMITTVSDPLAENLGKKHGKHKVHVILNGFEPDDLNRLDPNPIFPADGKYRIVYTGTVYKKKRDPSPLFEAIQRMNDNPKTLPLLKNLEVIFIGPNSSHLEELIRDYHMESWVKFLGFQSRDRALRMQRDAHALLFITLNDVSINGVLTGKIFEYLFSGTLILAIGGGGMEASQELIVNAKAGYAFHDVSSITQFLSNALSNPVKVNVNLSDAFLSTYHRKALANKMMDLISK